MEITLKERLELLLNWPSKGTPVKLMILDEIKALINISKEEREEYDVKENISETGDVSITWNQKGLTAVKEIKLSKDQAETLKETLDKMGENFPITLLELYKKL
jgi:hypothetical protein